VRRVLTIDLVMVFVNSYLCQEGYAVGALVSLFVSRIVQKLLNRSSQNFVERWYMGQGTKHWILPLIRIRLI